MLKKILLLLFLIILPFSACAQPVPPSKGRWALPLETSLPLYQAPDAKADSEYVELSEEWLKVPKAVRDEIGRASCRERV